MKLALCGIGKIAIDQHVPALMADPNWDLAATLSRAGQVDGVPAYQDLETLLADQPDIQVYSLCLPPIPRYDLAKRLIAAGKHVMLEKPPGASLAEVFDLENRARAAGLTLFTTWHSRMAQAVDPAKRWLADKSIKAAHITWREDVRRWHPGQDWVFDPGGMGVFDPGINALSILTEILPFSPRVLSADLDVPDNQAMPIGAKLQFADGVSADFDWRQEGPQTWEIEVQTTSGVLLLTDGGARLILDDVDQPLDGPDEYLALYQRMTHLLNQGRSDVDVAPMVLVADAFALARRHSCDAFHF